MIPYDIIDKCVEFASATAVLAGAFAWWRKGSDEEDEMVSNAADTVLGALSDADTVSKIGCVTDRNLRDQLTIEEAIEMNKERELRRFGWKRN